MKKNFFLRGLFLVAYLTVMELITYEGFAFTQLAAKEEKNPAAGLENNSAISKEEQEYKEYVAKYGSEELIKKEQKKEKEPEKNLKHHSSNQNSSFLLPKQNPFTDLSEERAIAGLKSQSPNIPFFELITKHPALIKIPLKILKDDHIYTEVISTYQDSQKFGNYKIVGGGGAVVFLILGFIFTARGGFISRIFKKLIFLSLLLAFQAMTFSFYFPISAQRITSIIKDSL